MSHKLKAGKLKCIGLAVLRIAPDLNTKGVAGRGIGVGSLNVLLVNVLRSQALGLIASANKVKAFIVVRLKSINVCVGFVNTFLDIFYTRLLFKYIVAYLGRNFSAY